MKRIMLVAALMTTVGGYAVAGDIASTIKVGMSLGEVFKTYPAYPSNPELTVFSPIFSHGANGKYNAGVQGNIHLTAGGKPTVSFMLSQSDNAAVVTGLIMWDGEYVVPDTSIHVGSTLAELRASGLQLSAGEEKDDGFWIVSSSGYQFRFDKSPTPASPINAMMLWNKKASSRGIALDQMLQQK